MTKKILTEEEAFAYFDSKMDAIFDRLEQSRYAGLSKPEKMIYLIMGFEGGVRGGGLSSYLGNPQGIFARDLISFLKEIGVGAVAKDIEAVIQDIQSASPSYAQDSNYYSAVKALPKEKAEAHQKLEEGITKRLWEYSSVLPQLHQHLSATNSI